MGNCLKKNKKKNTIHGPKELKLTIHMRLLAKPADFGGTSRLMCMGPPDSSQAVDIRGDKDLAVGFTHPDPSVLKGDKAGSGLLPFPHACMPDPSMHLYGRGQGLGEMAESTFGSQQLSCVWANVHICILIL